MFLYVLFLLCIALEALIFFTLGRKTHLRGWKKWIVLLSGALCGILGLKLMAFIENGSFNTISFFGAHFFGPMGIVLACLALRISRIDMNEILDLCAPALCASLVIHKINCYMSGCCQGILMKLPGREELVRFPSQLVECAFALVLMILFIVIIKRQKKQGRVYYLYMVFYGMGRYFLNLYRDPKPWVLNIPAGNFWSLISIALGLMLLFIHHRRLKRTNSVLHG